MGKVWSATTEEERTAIKTLGDLGVSIKEIKRITDRIYSTISAIISGNYEQTKEYDRKRQSERKAKLKQAEVATDKQAEQEPAPQEEPPIEATAQPSPFDDENLLKRIADSNDYTNALLNGILNRLQMLCKELGV